MSDSERPLTTSTRAALARALAVLAAAAAPAAAAAAGPLTSTLVPPNPPPDFGTVAYDPNNADNMGIAPDQYGYCQVCSPQPYTQVTGCSGPVGTQHACQAYCHVIDGTPLTYNANPPHSGNHFPEPERGVGEHARPIDRGHWVHSMEHGAVVLLYNCASDCSSDLETYRRVMSDSANACLPVIMLPEPTLKRRFAMASWTWTAVADQMFPQAQVDCFVKQHAKHGRECPPNGICPAFNFSGSDAAKRANCGGEWVNPPSAT